jgi:hypothetical protein
MRALLHPGAARRGTGQERQPLSGGPFDGVHDPFRRGEADGAGQEPENSLTINGHPASADEALAGDDGFVGRAVFPGPARSPVLLRTAGLLCRGSPRR